MGNEKTQTPESAAQQAQTTEPNESARREPADERTFKAATHETQDAAPQAPPPFDPAEAKEKTR